MIEYTIRFRAGMTSSFHRLFLGFRVSSLTSANEPAFRFKNPHGETMGKGIPIQSPSTPHRNSLVHRGLGGFFPKWGKNRVSPFPISGLLHALFFHGQTMFACLPTQSALTPRPIST